MFDRLLTFLRRGSPRKPGRKPATVRIPVQRPTKPQPAPAAEPRTFELAPDARAFLLGLVEVAEPLELQSLPVDDRLFLSGLIKRLSEDRFHVPVLPRTALEITRLMWEPFSTMSDFVRVIGADPALSLKILQVANSPTYGFCTRATHLQDALFRIGTRQVRTIVIFSHVQGKVLQAGHFQREVGWLSGLSTAMATVAKLLASDLGLPPDAAFTFGMLSQIEYFVMLAALPEIAREQNTRARPSPATLHEAFRRFGAKVRDQTLRQWQLPELTPGNAEGTDLKDRYDQLRRSLIVHWTGEPLPCGVHGVPPARLAEALEKMDPQGYLAPEPLPVHGTPQGGSPSPESP